MSSLNKRQREALSWVGRIRAAHRLRSDGGWGDAVKSTEVKKIVRWRCELCGLEYSKVADARECAALGFNPTLKVGDIVTIYSTFGWHDGDKAWVYPKRSEWHGKPTMSFYYVVTHVDRDERGGHRPRYHLVTDAMTGNEGYRRGYTFDEGHKTPTKISPRRVPAAVRRRAREIVEAGERAQCLI